MSDVRWVLKNGSGGEMRSTQGFASREEAESWMGREWAGLLEEGAESVALVDGDEVVYEMGLRAG